MPAESCCCENISNKIQLSFLLTHHHRISPPCLRQRSGRCCVFPTAREVGSLAPAHTFPHSLSPSSFIWLIFQEFSVLCECSGMQHPGRQQTNHMIYKLIECKEVTSQDLRASKYLIRRVQTAASPITNLLAPC